MNMNKFTIGLLAAGSMLAMTSVAMAEDIYIDVSAPADTYTGTAGDADSLTGDAEQLGINAETTTTQFDSDATGTLTAGDAFTDAGHLSVTSLIANVAIDEEGLDDVFAPAYQLTADWSALTGVTTSVTALGGGFTSTTTSYDAINGTIDVYFDSTADGTYTLANFDGTSGKDATGATTFTDGQLVMTLLITGGTGENLFSNGDLVTGSSVLEGEVSFVIDNMFFFATDDQDFFEFLKLGDKFAIFFEFDQNTDNEITLAAGGNVGGAGGVTCSNAANVLFCVLSDHNGSGDFNRKIPEPATLSLLAFGLLGVGVAMHRRRRLAA